MNYALLRCYFIYCSDDLREHLKNAPQETLILPTHPLTLMTLALVMINNNNNNNNN